MKKFMMALVFLMTMVVSVNAEEIKQLTKTLKTTIKCEDVYLPCWGENKHSLTSTTVTIDFNYFDEYGSSLLLTLKNEGGEVFNYFQDVSIFYQNKECWMIYNNIGSELLMIYLNNSNTYSLVIYDEAVMN